MGKSDAKPNEVQPAAIDDLPELFDLLDTANKYSVEESGVPAWKNIDVAREDMEAHLGAGETFVIRDQNGGISASITLSETADEWREAAQNGSALYLTKFMKDPAKAQPNDPTRLLKFAAEEAQRRDKPVLRCDTVTDQQGMVKYYKDRGFVEKGHFIYESSGREGVLLETPASDLAAHADAALLP